MFKNIYTCLKDIVFFTTLTDIYIQFSNLHTRIQARFTRKQEFLRCRSDNIICFVLSLLLSQKMLNNRT